MRTDCCLCLVLLPFGLLLHHKIVLLLNLKVSSFKVISQRYKQNCSVWDIRGIKSITNVSCLQDRYNDFVIV
uniref:Secreted protein n=1 Tax=Haemonchus placei TaxID=6290 RepID=A0A0N4W752_HAEPC